MPVGRITDNEADGDREAPSPSASDDASLRSSSSALPASPNSHACRSTHRTKTCSDLGEAFDASLAKSVASKFRSDIRVERFRRREVGAAAFRIILQP